MSEQPDAKIGYGVLWETPGDVTMSPSRGDAEFTAAWACEASTPVALVPLPLLDALLAVDLDQFATWLNEQSGIHSSGAFRAYEALRALRAAVERGE